MNFQQLRFVREAVRRNLNLTEVANVLQTSQSGVSKQIKDLEDELGIDLFVRHGKRLTTLTRPGAAVVELIERVLREKENLCQTAEHYAAESEGRLVLATTHTQARYALPPVIREFRKRYPGVHLALRQGSPSAVAEMVAKGEADIGVATEALDQYHNVTTFPAHTWRHVVAVPHDHPLANAQTPSLAHIAEYPIVTYDGDFSGRSHIDAAFDAAGLTPEIVLTAMDADVIKTYVEIGLGIGILAGMAIDPEMDKRLVVLNTEDLFEPNLTRIGVRTGAYLRDFSFRFIELFAPHLHETALRDRLSQTH